MTFFSLAGESYDAVGRVDEGRRSAVQRLRRSRGAAVRERSVPNDSGVGGRFTAEQRTYYEIVLEAQASGVSRRSSPA